MFTTHISLYKAKNTLDQISGRLEQLLNGSF